ncbi:hypothetical protein GCM10018779_56540 [Streptomyces griseocarneus]|nr:hypothetical protein GCM10018779_56540 [Streptomyces griseocarneus]
MAVDDGRNLGLAADAAGGALTEVGTDGSGELDLSHGALLVNRWCGRLPGPRQACYEERVDNGPPHTAFTSGAASLAEQLEESTRRGGRPEIDQ